MNIRKLAHGICGTLAAVVLTLSAASAGAARTFPKVTNVSPNPAGTNEFYLTATNMTVTNIGGTNVQVRVYMDDPPGGGGAPAGLPCPMIELNVGTMVICHFANKLTNNVEGMSIHWHGIELNNDSDGTAVTQDSIMPGQTYVYKFLVPRAGLFWYHSHMIPGTSTFNGMYGPLIVTNGVDATLISEGILPPTNYTFPLLLSDISFTNGVPGKVVNGVNYPLNTLIQLCENNALGTNSADQPFCGPAGIPGNIVLVNGYPPALAGSFSSPSANSTPIYTVANNSRVRLQLFDASISRDFNMSLHYPTSDPTGNTNLYRIGGQGGYLDNALLDGGIQNGYNFLYNQGSIVIGAGMRADVMFYPSGANGTVVELVGNPLPPPWNLSGTTAPGDGLTNVAPNYPIAFFIITNTGSTNAPLAAGSPIVAGTSFTNVSLKNLPTNALISPPTPSEGITPVGTITSPQGTVIPAGNILFENGLSSNATTNNGYIPQGPNIGGYAAVPLDGNTGDGSWLEVPHPPSALWARVGDVLQLAIINDVGGGEAMHPFHLHGFSMQPMYIYSANLLTNLYTFNYNEYLDTIEVYPGQAVIFRIRLTDRPNFADTATGGPVTYNVSGPSGGAVGRWLMHCHIFLHGTIGMMSELIAVSNTINRLEGPASGSDSAVLAGSPGTAWTASASNSWLHLSAPNQSGTGSTNVIFTYDVNTGSTRTGALSVAGETVAVTQAGSTYYQAPADGTIPFGGLKNPVAVVTDAAGNVYVNDNGNSAIKMWNVANNTMTTLVSGLNNPQGLGIDSLGNLYFSEVGLSKVDEWNAATHALTAPVPSDSDIYSVAADGAGNLYLALPGYNAINKYTAATSNLSTIIGSGLSAPFGVAVDLAGNLYIANTGANSILKWYPATSTLVTLIPSTAGLSSPTNVAVDLAGNVYIADSGNNTIKKWTAATSNLSTIIPGEGGPKGVSVDAAGNLYIADSGYNQVEEIVNAYVDPSAKTETGAAGSDFLPPVLPTNQNLGPPFTPSVDVSWMNVSSISDGIVDFGFTANTGASRFGYITVLNYDTPVTQSGPSYTLGTSALLQGPAAGSNSVVLAVVPNIATWTASANASWLHLSAANQSGTGSTNVVFGFDTNPGATRTGTLTIGGQTLTVTQAGSTYVQAPGPLTALVSSGLSDPVDVAADSSGNVYISDSGNNAIKEWSAALNTVLPLVTSGLSTPQGVAVDNSGNVYFSDFENSAVKEYVIASNSVITVVSNIAGPTGLSLDTMNNVYIASPQSGGILKWNPTAGTLTTVTTNGLLAPYGVAVDVAGNVYIADTDHNAVKEWIAANNTVIPLVTNQLSSPWDVSVDGSGNVYIADGNDAQIKEWNAASNSVVTLVASGISEPTDVAVDALRNIYIANFGENQVDELPYAFVDPTTRFETSAGGSDALPVVLSSLENLNAPFTPTSTQPWLSINSTVGGIVHFSFTANTGNSNRSAGINLLGETIQIIQTAAISPIHIVNPRIVANGVFQFGFTNSDVSATFSILYSTNIATPLTNWTYIGAASNVSPGVLQFTDLQATNSTRFYMVRSP